MTRAASFLLLVLFPAVLIGQVPPGDAFDRAKHPNPIITFVTNTAFMTSTYAAVHEATGMELLGLSSSEGTRQSIELAPGMMRRTTILGRVYEVTYYPVVRQIFKLTGGQELSFCSFKFPRIGTLTPNAVRQLLNQAVLEKKRNPADMRLGTDHAPEQFDIRGSPALLFESDGLTTVYWQEEGIGYTASANLNRMELFRIIEDLL